MWPQSQDRKEEQRDSEQELQRNWKFVQAVTVTVCKMSMLRCERDQALGGTKPTGAQKDGTVGWQACSVAAQKHESCASEPSPQPWH